MNENMWNYLLSIAIYISLFFVEQCTFEFCRKYFLCVDLIVRTMSETFLIFLHVHTI
jgi:hypothetical protein